MVAYLSAVLLLILLFTRSVPAIDSPTAEANRRPVPTRIDGVEIEQIHGWFANIYPWKDPRVSSGTVYDPIGPFAVFSELIEGA